MAKSAFSSRFPHAGKFLFLALVIGLGMTVYSVQKAPTTTEQHAAAAASCLPNVACPAGFYCTYPQGPNHDGTCLPVPLDKPTGLKAYSSYCKSGSPVVEYDTINFNWNRVAHATSYTLYWRIYTTNNSYSYKTASIKDDGQSHQNYLLHTKSLNGRRVQWYIKALNSNTSTNSDVLNTPGASRSCP